jgi:hypothetical protein
MADPTKTDKKTESINALKNANKHLADVFADLNNKDGTMSNVASELQYIARQCGDIKVQTYIGNQHQMVALKGHLEALAIKLNGAR